MDMVLSRVPGAAKTFSQMTSLTSSDKEFSTVALLNGLVAEIRTDARHAHLVHTTLDRPPRLNSLAIAVILASTFMHAGWNLIGKQQRSVHRFFESVLWGTVAMGFLPAIIAELYLPTLPLRAFGCVLASSFCCSVYMLSLANAYGVGDFTVVYPMARAIPVVLVGIADVLRGHAPTVSGWFGMLFVTVGCLITPMPSLRGFTWACYFNRTQMWIWLTALGTVGYTLFDKWAAEAVPPGLISALRYGYLYFSGSAVFYSVLRRIFGKHDKKHEAPSGRRRVLLGSFFMYGAYGLVLWAYQLSHQAGYVVAFRQFSIVIGVVLGLLLLHERNRAVRLLAVMLICAGLVMVGVWG